MIALVVYYFVYSDFDIESEYDSVFHYLINPRPCHGQRVIVVGWFVNPRSRRAQRVTVVRLSVCLFVCLFVTSESPHLDATALHLQHG